jgi:hypothetical protein
MFDFCLIRKVVAAVAVEEGIPEVEVGVTVEAVVVVGVEVEHPKDVEDLLMSMNLRTLAELGRQQFVMNRMSRMSRNRSVSHFSMYRRIIGRDSKRSMYPSRMGGAVVVRLIPLAAVEITFRGFNRFISSFKCNSNWMIRH